MSFVGEYVFNDLVCGPDLLRFWWAQAVADHAALYAFDLPLDVYLSISQPASTVSSNDMAKSNVLCVSGAAGGVAGDMATYFPLTFSVC